MDPFPGTLNALIIGNSGTMSLCIVRKLLRNKATVIAPVKNALEIEMLQSQAGSITSGRLITYLSDKSDINTVRRMNDIVSDEYGHINLVVYISEDTRLSPFLSEVNINEWDNMVTDELTPCFIAGKVYIEHCKPFHSGMFIHIVKQDNFIDKPYSGLANIAAVAQMEMINHFAQEAVLHNLRFYHVVVGRQLKTEVQTPQAIAASDTEDLGHFILKLYETPSTNGDGNTFLKFRHIA